VSPQFSVKAGWPDGSIAEESILAPDALRARSEIERRGGQVFEVRRRGFGLPGVRAGRHGRVRMTDFLIFNHEMIALLKAGLPVVRSFEILLERQRSVALRRVLSNVKDRVNSGASISDAFAEQGDIFPRLYSTSLKAGEKSGEIESVLRRYLKYQKTVMGLTRKVVSTLVYPAILILLSIGLIAILMTVVIPRFNEFFADFGAELPLLTVVVLKTAGFVRDNAVLLFAGLAFGGFLASRWLKTASGRVWRDAMSLKLPFVGRIFQRFAITQFTRSLATLLGGGTPLVPALENAADAIGNQHVSRKVREVVPRVREGGELWQALDATGIFTNLTIEMIKVGETSGALEEMLSSVSEFYDEEIDTLLGRVITIVEPAILVIMGGVIVTLLLSIYLPIFSIMSQIRG
jgi:type IV pilus assembly protein PilC